MNISKEKVDSLYRGLGLKVPGSPEQAISKVTEAIKSSPGTGDKILKYVEELKKKIRETGGDWDNIKVWLANLFTNKNSQPMSIESQEDPNVKSKMVPDVIKEEPIATALYTVLVGSKQAYLDFLKKIESMPLTSEVKKDIERYQSTFINPMGKLSSVLDDIANSLESKGLIKEAFRIDKIADASKEYLLKKDNTPINRKEAEELKPRILAYIKEKGKVSMQDIYAELKCNDIPMYLALHDLVKSKEVKGESPYEASHNSHSEYLYTF